MARLPRLSIPGLPHHVIQRGHGGDAVFFDDGDYLRFLADLRGAAVAHGVAIHAYVLMPNHVHLLATPSTADMLGKTMQSLGRQYVRWLNQKHSRTGSLWDGRYRSTVIEAERYLLACSLYIELNPVRAGLVADPAEYPWSSFRHHAGLTVDPLVTDHPVVWALGNTPFERQSAYKARAAHGLAAEDIDRLRWATNRGWALGGAEFLIAAESESQRPLSPRARGRRAIFKPRTP